MSVYKPAKSPYFHYDFQYQGRRFFGSTKQSTKRAAEKVEARKIRAVTLGEIDPEDIPTLRQGASAWWLERAQHLATADDIWVRIGHCERLLGRNTLLPDIDSDALAKAIRRRSAETYSKSKKKGARRYPVQPATVNADIIATMRRIFRHAVKRQKALKALIPDIDWGELRLPEPEPQIRIYTQAQRERWLAECDDVARFALTMLLTYGLRFGELFFPPGAYHPAEVEGEAAFLLLDKRKKERMILPLRADDARQVAARAGRAEAAGLEHIWMETGRGGALVLVTYDGLYARLMSAARRAGIASMGRAIHGARHHAGSMMLRSTGDLKKAQQLLGHKRIESTTRYAHVLTSELAAALEGQSRNSPEPELPEGEFTPPKQRRRT